MEKDYTGYVLGKMYIMEQERYMNLVRLKQRIKKRREERAYRKEFKQYTEYVLRKYKQLKSMYDALYNAIRDLNNYSIALNPQFLEYGFEELPLYYDVAITEPALPADFTENRVSMTYAYVKTLSLLKFMLHTIDLEYIQDHFIFKAIKIYLRTPNNNIGLYLTEEAFPFMKRSELIEYGVRQCVEKLKNDVSKEVLKEYYGN